TRVRAGGLRAFSAATSVDGPRPRSMTDRGGWRSLRGLRGARTRRPRSSGSLILHTGFPESIRTEHGSESTRPPLHRGAPGGSPPPRHLSTVAARPSLAALLARLPIA